MNQFSKQIWIASLLISTLAWADKPNVPSLSPACQKATLNYSEKCKNPAPTDPNFKSCMGMLREVGQLCNTPASESGMAFLENISEECKILMKKYCQDYRDGKGGEKAFYECFQNHQAELSKACNSPKANKKK